MASTPSARGKLASVVLHHVVAIHIVSARRVKYVGTGRISRLSAHCIFHAPSMRSAPSNSQRRAEPQPA